MKLLHDRYQVVRELGRGGDGVVYLCSDVRLTGSLWAIKEVPVDQAFEREASLLSQLNHPRIPMVVDFFSEGPFGYLVREYLDGPSLHAWIEKHGPVSESQAIYWAIHLAEILQYLHQRVPPIYHRDLKPHNLILRPDGVHLIDFGLAREDRGQLSSEQAGSLSFTAPEQFQAGHRLAPEADIFSLGAILYYVLTGFPPAPTGGDHRIASRRNDISPASEQLVLDCLQPDPRLRPKQVEQILHGLQLRALQLPRPQANQEQPPSGLSPRIAPALPSRLTLFVSLVPLLALLGLAAGLALSQLTSPHPGSPPPPQPQVNHSIPWSKIQQYMAEGRWYEAEGALKVTLTSQPQSGWAQLALSQLELARHQAPRVPLLLPLGGQEEEHVNWILQGVALGQRQETRFLFDLIDTHSTSSLAAWQQVQSRPGLNLILGPFGSQDALLLAPLTHQVAMLPLGSTDPRVAEAGPSIFPLGFPHGKRIAAALTQVTRERGGHGLIFYSKDSKAMATSAKSAQEEYLDLTGRTLPQIGFQPDQDSGQILEQVADVAPNWVYLSDNLHQRSAEWIARLRRAGLEVPIICVFHPASMDFIEELKGLPGQVWLAEPLWQVGNGDFLASWQRVFGPGQVDWNSALGFDAAQLASRNWSPRGPQEVLRNFRTSRPLSGLLGTYDLAQKTFQPRPFRYRIVIIEDGQVRPGAELEEGI